MSDHRISVGRRTQPDLPHAAWVLAGGAFVNCLGNFVVPFLVPYLIHRGYGTRFAAEAVSAYAAGKIAAGVGGGLLTDRFGARLTTSASMAGSAAATMALAVASGPALILFTAGLTGLVSEMYRPATSAVLAAEVPGPQRVRAFGVYQLGVSAGTAAGVAAGGLIAEHSFLILFGGDAATSLAWAIGAWRVLPRTRAASPVARSRQESRRSSPEILRNRQLACLLGETVLINLILFQAQTTLPVWVHHQGLPTSSYGLLLALNSGLLVALQLPVAKLTSRWQPQAVIASTSVLIAAGFGLLTLAHTSMLLVTAVSVWSLGELAQWPVAAAYTTSLAPPGMTGRYAGARSLCYGTALLIAPLAGTAVYNLSPAALWGGCAAAGICAAAVIAPLRSPGLRRGRSRELPASALPEVNQHLHDWPVLVHRPERAVRPLAAPGCDSLARPWFAGRLPPNRGRHKVRPSGLRMEELAMTNSHELVSRLLNEAGETHHRVFRIVDGVDDDWASWYADWLVNLSELPDALGLKPIRSELTYLLVSLDKQYTTEQAAERWEDYYAERIADHFRPRS